jgi:hypothetical protein
MSAKAAIDSFTRARDRHLEDLKTLVRIPSVSAGGFDAAQVARSADAVARLLRERGLENVELLKVDGSHPYVYGDWLHAPGKPTVLLYAHHDVQPLGREEIWKTPPFEPTMGAGRPPLWPRRRRRQGRHRRAHGDRVFVARGDRQAAGERQGDHRGRRRDRFVAPVRLREELQAEAGCRRAWC